MLFRSYVSGRMREVKSYAAEQKLFAEMDSISAPRPSRATLQHRQSQRFAITKDSLFALHSTYDVRVEASRCLHCDVYCGICVSLCPNRANVLLPSPPLSYAVQEAVRQDGDICIRTLGNVQLRQAMQVVNIADFCNECGNCAAFCPSSGAPYEDKARWHISHSAFATGGEGWHFSTPDILEGVTPLLE